MIVEETITRMEPGMLQQPEGRMLCPFILTPFDECYCASTSSLHTEATIRYCGGNYASCDIYKEHAESGRADE